MIKRKGDKLYVKWKGYNISFNSWIDKNYIVQTSEHFPKPNSSGANVKVELDLSNYAIKTDLNMQQVLMHHLLLKKSDLANLESDLDKLDIDKVKNIPSALSSLKSKVDKLNVDKLVPVPVDLGKLTDMVKTDVVKKNLYNAKIKNVEDKVLDFANLAIKTTLNAKINEVKEEIPSITNLATTTALSAVENKIPIVSNLLKKSD